MGMLVVRGRAENGYGKHQHGKGKVLFGFIELLTVSSVISNVFLMLDILPHHFIRPWYIALHARLYHFRTWIPVIPIHTCQYKGGIRHTSGMIRIY
jgi:hypothetical protein